VTDGPALGTVAWINGNALEEDVRTRDSRVLLGVLNRSDAETSP
jgi:hypothetical protein